jgi:peptidoglycan/LPS O-acetylase OafA/YrhL
MSGRLRYLPALDGVRAFAVAGVLCYHASLAWAPGGFLGVDMFFVLSGFLITTLLLREKTETGGIALKAFWVRRARRLLPALGVLLVIVVVYAVFLAAPEELRTIRADALASIGYVANWRFITSGSSYFEQFQAPSPLRHMWSLAIEEQFYLIWPLIAYGVFRVAKDFRRGLALVTGGMLVTSVVLMTVLYEPGRDPSRVYYGTDTRAQSLLVGALLSILMIQHPVVEGRVRRMALQVAGIVAAVGLAVMWVSVTDRAQMLYRGGFLLEAVLVATVIAAVIQPRPGPLGALLSVGWIRWIGQISYGLYLYHWPVYVALDTQRIGLDGYALFAVRLAVTFAIATASYYLLEMPIRRGTFSMRHVRALIPGTLAAVLAGVLLATAGAPPAKVEVSAADVRAPQTAQLVSAHATPTPRVMLVGDSVASSLAPGLTRQAADGSFVFFDASVLGCGLSSTRGEHWVGEWAQPEERCFPEWRERWARDVTRFDPRIVVLMMSGHDAVDRRIDGQEIAFDSDAGAELERADVRDAIAVLSSHGAHVVVLTLPYGRQPWRLPVDPRRSGFNPAWVDRLNNAALEVVAGLPDQATMLDLNHLLSPDGYWTGAVDGIQVRAPDTIHLSDAGADFVAAWLVPQALPLVATEPVSDARR